MPHDAPRLPESFSEADLDRLQALLDALPAPLEPLDVSMVDGYLCGVLLQPQPVPAARWLPHVTDAQHEADVAALVQEVDPDVLSGPCPGRRQQAPG